MIRVYSDKWDINGNFLRYFLTCDEEKTPLQCEIVLKLKGEPRTRNIGTVRFKDKTIFFKRNSSKHLHRNSNSYGFNYEVLNDAFLNIKWVVCDIDGELYRFPKKTIDDFGSYLHFKSQGFELQRFLKFDLIKNFKYLHNEKLDEKD